MKTIPLEIGPIHFVGIGGIGMSGIAELMHNLGYKVQGSDRADGANIRRLRRRASPSPSATPRKTSATPRWWSSRRRSRRTIPRWWRRASC